MNDLIQCPTCAKKYRLGATVPKVFTCKQCGTAMDLSAFAAAPAAAPAPAPAAAASSGSPAVSRSRGSSRTSRGGRGRAGRARHAEDDDDDDRGRRGAPPPKKGNTALILGSAVAFVVAVVAVIFLMKDDKKGEEPPAVAGAPSGSSVPQPGTGPSGTAQPGVAQPGPSGGAPPGSGTSPGTQPAKPAEPAGAGADKPKPGRSMPLSKVSLQRYDPPADVTADERKKMDEAIYTDLNVGGRDADEAEAYLVSMGLKAVHRLVSEFKNIEEKQGGLESRTALMHAMIIDRTLRKIDGFMERKAKVYDKVKPESDPDFALDVMKRWNVWIQTEAYKTPLKPWDPRVDMTDDEAKEEGAAGK
jgi:hypothetical protein